MIYKRKILSLNKRSSRWR